MGKCAELCGEYHSLMLFQVKVVSVDEYNAYIESQKAAGFEGDLGKDYDRLQNLPGTAVPTTTESSEE
jgi:cytochrome c oxidase subunit 2